MSDKSTMSEDAVAQVDSTVQHMESLDQIDKAFARGEEHEREASEALARELAERVDRYSWYLMRTADAWIITLHVTGNGPIHTITASTQRECIAQALEMPGKDKP